MEPLLERGLLHRSACAASMHRECSPSRTRPANGDNRDAGIVTVRTRPVSRLPVHCALTAGWRRVRLTISGARRGPTAGAVSRIWARIGQASQYTLKSRSQQVRADDLTRTPVGGEYGVVTPSCGHCRSHRGTLGAARTSPLNSTAMRELTPVLGHDRLPGPRWSKVVTYRHTLPLRNSSRSIVPVGELQASRRAEPPTLSAPGRVSPRVWGPPHNGPLGYPNGKRGCTRNPVNLYAPGDGQQTSLAAGRS